MVACSEEDISQVSTASSSGGITTVLISGNSRGASARRTSGKGQLALCFQDEATLEKFKTELSNMSSDEREHTISKYGVANLHTLAAEADKELEEIGTNATSEEDFRARYAEYKQKYDGFLLADPKDSTDLSLYVPDGDNIESYIGNTNGFYMVGGKIESVNLKHEVSKAVLLMSNAAPTAGEPTNTSVYSPKKHKRVYFSAYMQGIYLWVSMSCKKKMWYGWKNDPDRSYYFDPYLSSNFAYLTSGKYGQDVEMGRLPRYIFNNNTKNGFSIILGKLKGAFPITGEFYTWTDMTSEHDANGNDITEKINGYVVPKCLKSKAHVVKINLTNVH